MQIAGHVADLLDLGVRTFHVDINYPDYQVFGGGEPVVNTTVFTPAFLSRLSRLLARHGAFLNLHLLTREPHAALSAYTAISLGAVCFQLDAVATADDLRALVSVIHGRGACASPVVETVGTALVQPHHA